MNKDRRNRLLEASSQLDEAIATIQDIQDEEQEAFDNMPEGLQCSARGESMMEAIEKMDSFIEAITTIQGEIEDFAK